MNEELIDVSAGDLMLEETAPDVSAGDSYYSDVIEQLQLLNDSTVSADYSFQLDSMNTKLSNINDAVEEINTSIVALVSVTSCIFLIVLVSYVLKSVKRIMKGFGGRNDI